MIGEEGEASFKIQYQQFDITLRMSSDDILSIAVEDTRTLERYSRGINQEYIMQQDTSFQRIFEEPKDIYDYLKASPSLYLTVDSIKAVDSTAVDREFLVFNYRYSRSRVKRIRFQLIRENIDRVEQANQKMEKMQEDITAQLLQKDIEVKELKQKQEEMTQILQEIKGEIRAEKAKTRELAETLEANTGKLEAVAHSISLVPVKKSKQMIMESYEQVRVFQKIDHHPDNAHKQYYTLNTLTETSARITRIGNSGYYNFVNKCEVLPNQNAKYSLTINKTPNNYMMIGFCTEKGLGNIINHEHAESAYYQCDGTLWQGGSRKYIGVGIPTGETVECVADLVSCKLSWWEKSSQIAECGVPAGMRNKPIYISIILFNTGDEVDLCT